MVKFNYKLFILLIVLFLSIGCSAQDINKELSVKELKLKMKTDSALVILDVRTPPELEGELGHLKGVINIPVQELEKRISELTDIKDKNIAVICLTGRRSAIATQILLKHGFKAVNVRGGMIAYRADE